MLVVKKSLLSGVTATMEIDVTQEKLDRYARGNSMIQRVFPDLTTDEREFIKTGITPTERANMIEVESRAETNGM